eukprot:316419-Amphidinium_carterae.1
MLTVDISTPRTPVAGGQLAPVGPAWASLQLYHFLGRQGVKRPGQMYQTVARWGMELEAEMRQVSNQHQVFRAEHNAQMVRIRQPTALRATPHQLIHASVVRASRKATQANDCQCSTTGKQSYCQSPRGSPWVPKAVQDNAEVVIAQRLNHEASVYQNILNGNIHQRDEEYMQLIRSWDEEYVSSMAAVTAQRDVDLLNLSHVQEAQTYRQEITTYMSEAAQLNQNLQHMTQLNEHSGQAQATSDWTLRTQLQAANRELSLSETRE